MDTYTGLSADGTIGIMRANRLATDAERAYAWATLMSSAAPTDAEAIQHACDVFCDRVAARLRTNVSEAS